MQESDFRVNRNNYCNMQLKKALVEPLKHMKKPAVTRANNY
jgi:hypothetical protein